MQERNVIGGAIAVALSGMIEFLYPIRYLALLAIVLIIVDLRFGIRAAKIRGEEIRFSRAIRRTGNKIVDYTCWLLLAVSIGRAFGTDFNIEILPSIILALIFGIEINSCIGNYFKIQGKSYKINILKLFTGNPTSVLDIDENQPNKEENTD